MTPGLDAGGRKRDHLRFMVCVQAPRFGTPEQGIGGSIEGGVKT